MKPLIELYLVKALTTLFLITSYFVNATPSSGCGTQLPNSMNPGNPSQNVTIDVAGTGRSYLIYIPTNYNINTPAPLVLNYHGGQQIAREQETLTQMSNPYFNDHSIIVYPQGLNEQWQGDPSQPSSIDDVLFTSSLLQSLLSSYCISKSQIYATGISDGGGFLGLLACDPVLSALITAFAPVAGAFYSQFGENNQAGASTCSPSRSPIPILEIHGAIDSTIPYYGGVRRGLTLPSIPEWLSGWAARDGIAAANSSGIANGDGSGSDGNVTTELYGGQVTVSKWMVPAQNGSTGEEMVAVVGFLVAGMGHTWPSTEPNLDSTQPTYFNATSVVFDFFAGYQYLPVTSVAPSPATTTGSVSGGVSSTSTPALTSPTTSLTGKSGGRRAVTVDVMVGIEFVAALVAVLLGSVVSGDVFI